MSATAQITLEVELDLPLDPEQVARQAKYRDKFKAVGFTTPQAERMAWERVAQDALDCAGAVVQGAEAVAT